MGRLYVDLEEVARSSVFRQVLPPARPAPSRLPPSLRPSLPPSSFPHCQVRSLISFQRPLSRNEIHETTIFTDCSSNEVPAFDVVCPCHQRIYLKRHWTSCPRTSGREFTLDGQPLMTKDRSRWSHQSDVIFLTSQSLNFLSSQTCRSLFKRTPPHICT